MVIKFILFFSEDNNLPEDCKECKSFMIEYLFVSKNKYYIEVYSDDRA